MSQPMSGPTAERAAALGLSPAMVASLKAQMPTIASMSVAAIVQEVPSYAGAWRGQMGPNIEGAVQIALRTFLNLAARSDDPSTPLGPALEAAYALGRGEARSGRSMDALLSAYRVGARVSWRELSSVGVAEGMSAPVLAQFAELVFAYIDELSAASVAGHSDELTTSGRVLERAQERLARRLLAGQPPAALAENAERVGWLPPQTLTVVLLPGAQVHAARATLDARTLIVSDDLPAPQPEAVPGAAPGERAEVAALLIPDMGGAARATLVRILASREAVVGPARPWTRAAESYQRAVRAHGRLRPGIPDALLDTEEHLAELVLAADPEAVEDLRARVLAPLDELTPAARERLVETLRSWLLHHGKKDAVAADLFVHPQTVRYRLGQLREVYGDALDDPRTILDLTIALGGERPRSG